MQYEFVADILRIQAKERPGKVATTFNDKQVTYGELDGYANQCAQGLISEGMKPDGRIGYMGKNSDIYFQMLGGAFKAKSVLVGVNWRLAGPEVEFILTDSKTEILFVTEDFYETVAAALDKCPDLRKVIAMDGPYADWETFESWRDKFDAVDPMLPHAADDDIIQLYTSGTTGYPKGVQLTNANYVDAEAQSRLGGWADWKPEDVNFVCMPLFHVAGVNIGIFGMNFGCENVILKDVDPAEILRLFEKHKVTIAFMVPAVIQFLLMMPNINDVDLSSLKKVIYGASPISEDVLMKAQEVFKCDFIQVYGMTETTGMGTSLQPEDHDPARGKLRSCGKPNPGVEVRIVDEDGNDVPQGEVGEILMKMGANMKGYWNRPEATAETIKDGYLYTGDAGFLDEEGFVFIHDRVKDMIVSGGENVYPAEVENALHTHPEVADAAAVGIPDDKWGEAVKGIVVRAPGSEVSEEDIIAHVKTQIAGYKVPKSIDFAEALPRNPSGKILRRELRAPFWEGRDRNVG